jgi:phage terminase large subunit
MLTEKPHRFLVVRKVAKTLRESCFAELKRVIYDWGVEQLFDIPVGVSSELYIKCNINNNEILFAGLDDTEKLKSITGITNIWIEEASEIEAEDFRQLDIRMRGKTVYYKQFLLSFNPTYITHWLKNEFFNEKKLKANCKTVHSTYGDNKFLDDQAIEVLESFKEVDPYYYMVYCLGQWGVVGKTIFDAQKVTERLVYLKDKKPLKEGYFYYDYVNEKIIDTSIKWVDEPNGFIKIYEDIKPGYPYVLGGDTAGEGSDNFTGQIIDNTNGKQVATLKHQFDEDLYTKQIYCLGKYYNSALIGLETNFSTYPTKELSRLGYNNLYVRESEDTFTGNIKKSYGFQTNKTTRPIIISNLVQIVRENIKLVNDSQTLEEMLTFVRNENSKPEAQKGKHDDLILALAITYYIRGQQRMTIFEQVLAFPKNKKIPKDLIDDYYNAPQEERSRLLRKWGLA